MTGYHEVKTFTVGGEQYHNITALPPGWKPFAVIAPKPAWGYQIVARRWVREDDQSKGGS